MTGPHANMASRDRQIVDAYLAGQSPPDIAAAFSLSAVRIMSILRARSCPLRPRATSEQRLAIADAYSAGENTVTIAARFGISRQRVEQIARARGLPHRAPQKCPHQRDHSQGGRPA